MMAVPMDNASEASSRECVQHLYNKNVELETKRRRSAQSRIPSDPNVWQQMRENFETIILEDHAFAQQHEVEFALWQLHYKRIEELRSNFNSATALVNSPGQGGKAGSAQPDRIPKIRSQFKAFLSEATGFYHELMLKIRAKYGLPLGYSSDDTENEAVLSKEGNKSADLKKGLISCHRCSIYLGDLARYKGIYGDEESKSRDFAAASSYYTQAASFWPSSGNPHHQLAILASYSADEFVAIYHYFRSLAVENPFSMARDNLIIAFEKNRMNYSQLIGGAKTSTAKPVAVRMNGKGRARAEARFSAKDQKAEVVPVKGAPGTVGTTKTFSVKFVRLNGILFTRTSMETFADVLSTARKDFMELLSSYLEHDHGFGGNASESGLFVIRLVAIMIFSVHNASRESEDQSQQRAVLLQNALTAAYDFMGPILVRCLKLQDPSSTFLLPGVLVFVEWLASHPEVVNSDEEEKLAKVRTLFWNNCISFFNKLVSTGFMGEDEDETCFFNISRYEEGETANRLALWEDFELRGFLPLQPAHQVLDFSRRHSFGNEKGNKEKRARIQRIFAAGKTFSNVVRVGEQVVYFDPKLKKFAIGPEPQVSCDFALNSTEMPQFNGDKRDVPSEKRTDLVGQESSPQLVDGEDEEEEIVFKPFTADKYVDAAVSVLNPNDVVRTAADAPLGQMGNYVRPVAPATSGLGQNSCGASATSGPVSSGVAQLALPTQPYSSSWQLKQEASVMNGFRNVSLIDNGHSMNMKLPEQYGGLQPSQLSLPLLQPVKPGAAMQPVHEAVMPSKTLSNLSPASTQNGASIKPMPLLPIGAKKNPFSRPLRHVGPPPGFSPAPSKNSAEMTMMDDLPLVDDYSWLDGYHTPFTVVSSGFNDSPNLSMQAYNNMSKSNSVTGMVTFPFPGKQASTFQVPVENSKPMPDYHFSQPQNLFQEQHQQSLWKGNQQAMPLQKQFPGQSLWEGHFFA